MKQTLFAIGCVLGTAVFAQQNQPDSIHVVLHENKDGNVRTLDTIVPLSQQQQLFTWMEANGWEAPPAPPTPPHAPVVIERHVVVEGDSGAPNGQRMMFVTMEGDSIPAGQPQMIMIKMTGEPGEMPPPPPGCRMKIIEADGQGGETVIMRGPAVPPVPGSAVTVDIEEKDTVIDGKKHKMIIRTERIILPEGVQAPPVPPMPPQAPAPPAPPQVEKQPQGTVAKQELLVYPNPASEVITVEFDVNAKEKTTLRVIDMNGKVVYTEQIVDDSGKHIYREINLSGKGKGTYTVEVKSAGKAIVKKVILQ